MTSPVILLSLGLALTTFEYFPAPGAVLCYDLALFYDDGPAPETLDRRMPMFIVGAP